jgi:hypothetical protein
MVYRRAISGHGKCNLCGLGSRRKSQISAGDQANVREFPNGVRLNASPASQHRKAEIRRYVRVFFSRVQAAPQSFSVVVLLTEMLAPGLGVLNSAQRLLARRFGSREFS